MFLFEIMGRGGDWMWVLLGALLIGLGIVAERAFALFIRTWLDPRKFLAQVMAHVEAGNYARALESCNIRSGHPLPKVLKAGLMKANRREREIERAMEEEMLRAIPRLNVRMSYIALLANIATLIGLLGTIMGLIHAFEAVSSASAAARQQMLAEGISQAMLTTAFGLITAVPMMIFHTILTARQERILFSVEEAATSLLGALAGRRSRQDAGRGMQG
jgi:biopolymer transport protein ExbB/TolQ